MIIINRKADLTRLCRVENMNGVTFTGEQDGHKFIVEGTRGDERVEFTGTVTGRFIRPDGVSVALTEAEDYAGIDENGAAWVTLAANCYTVAGPFGLVITNIDGGARTVIYSCTGYVRPGETSQIVDPENIINIDAIMGIIDDMQDALTASTIATAAANAAATGAVANFAPPYAANTAYSAGDYVTNAGGMYRITADITAADNTGWSAVSKAQVTAGGEIADAKLAAEETASGEATFDLSEYDVINCTVSSSNKATRSDENYQSVQIPVAANIYKTVKFVGNASKAGLITFLKTAIPATVSNNANLAGYLATGETGRHLVDAGVTETFTVPADARYFFVSIVSNSQSVVPVEVTASTEIVGKIDAVSGEVDAAYEMLSESRDILAPYESTAKFMRADGTLTTATDKRLYKYRLGYSVLDNTIYLNGKGTFSSNSNPYCYLWFVQNGTLMQGGYIPALVNPTYYEMQAVTVPTGAEEVWVDRTMKVYTRVQTVTCMDRIGGIEKYMSADTVTDPMPIPYATTTKYYINYENGMAYGDNNFAITDYVPVAGFKTVTYGRIAFSDSAATIIGMAFYDKDRRYISGQAADTGAASLAHVATDIDVPSGACFMRCSIRRYLAGFAVSGTSGFVRAVAAASAAETIGGQWRGKVWYAYGTSLTSETAGHYGNHVASMSGMELHNKALPGEGMVSGGHEIYDALIDMTDGKLDADLITIECGANDGTAPIGDPTSMDTTTICGALNDAIKKMFDGGIKAQVVLMCSFPSRYKANDSTTKFDVTSIREGGGTWLDLSDSIRKVAMANGLYYIAFNGLGISRARGNGMYGDLWVTDNIHPTLLGGYNIALGVWYQLRNIPVFYSVMPT